MNKYFYIALLLLPSLLFAQEKTAALQAIPASKSKMSNSLNKQRAILPFFDDFSSGDYSLNTALWVENLVYVNNSFGWNMLSKGVATFDGLNAQGRPYRPNDFSASGYGDSLTSQPINFSVYAIADSLYLSFLLQPAGLGFEPETWDSFFVFFRNVNNDWIKIWQKQGSGNAAFTPIHLAINDAQFFHDSFQFRFVNYTSLNSNDDIWNLDYVYLNTNRTEGDIFYEDVAFTETPTSILSPYSSLPYRHYKANEINEKSTSQNLVINNSYPLGFNVNVLHTAKEIISSTNLSSNTINNQSINALSLISLSNPSYNFTYNPPNPNDKVHIRNTYWYAPVNSLDVKSNDSIIADVIFDNYFAYDDGSAEQAYFLYPAINMPSKTAIKFHLNQTDTVRGLAVYFAPQVPSSEGKYFSIILYDSLGNSIGNDIILKQQDLYQVLYTNNRNEFSTYAFDQAVVVPAGDYYIGISQPANFGSDSIYYGLDVNTNHNIDVLSYNVNGYWYNSSIQGSIMMRAIVGSSFVPTKVEEVIQNELHFYPNPVQDYLILQGEEIWEQYIIYAIDGKVMEKGTITQNKINTSKLSSGHYCLQIKSKKGIIKTTQICKQ